MPDLAVVKHFVDASGNYLGVFDGAEPPKGAIEVATPPTHGKQIWQNGAWLAYTPPPNQDTIVALLKTLPQDKRLKFGAVFAQGKFFLEAAMVDDVKALIEGVAVDDAIEAQALAAIRQLFGMGA